MIKRNLYRGASILLDLFIDILSNLKFLSRANLAYGSEPLLPTRKLRTLSKSALTGITKSMLSPNLIYNSSL